jgi:hypothetical protein
MLAYIFFVLALSVRFVPHIMNFSPLGAALLFFGANRPKKEWPAVLALAMVADALLTTQVYHLAIRWDYLASFPYYVAALFIGSLLANNASVVRVAAASIFGSLVFFITSNFVAWLSLPMYTKDLHGLIQAYVLAIPFFRSTFASGLVYAAVMFGTPAVIAMMQRKRALIAVRH